MSVTVGHLVIGPHRHGVVRCAADMAAAIGGPRVTVATTTDARAALPMRTDRVHVHFTDRLFGSTAAVAADEFTVVAELVGAPTSVTLHDVPQPSDGSAFTMRADAYRRVITAADGVIVSSEHERLLLGEYVGPAADVRVIPLALEAPRAPSRPRPPRRDDVGVLGFIYPGKGHAEVIEALATVDGDVGILAVGDASEGHQHLVTDLAAAAERSGVRFATTGFVDDADLESVLRSVGVPVAFHRHLSASGSINSWITAGRRPLVPRNRYTEEIEARTPGALWIHGDSTEALACAIGEAVADPELTWTDDTVVPFPSTAQAAEMYRAAFDEWALR